MWKSLTISIKTERVSVIHVLKNHQKGRAVYPDSSPDALTLDSGFAGGESKSAEPDNV
jgi:hypothetical protein